MKPLFLFLLSLGIAFSGCKKDSDEVKIPIVISSVIQNVSVYGASDGAITLTVTGGKPDYTYSWSNGSTTKDLSGLAIGTYKIKVTDQNGDTATHSGIVSEPTELMVSYEKKDETSVGKLNGSISLDITGGIPPYSIAWSNSAITDSIGGLSAGIYSVTVTDYNGASVHLDIEVYAPLKLTASSTDATTFGGSNGSVDLLVEGGVAPLTYAWSNGSTQKDLTGVEAGYYEVTVKGADNKFKKVGITVYEPYNKATTESDILAHVDLMKQSGMRIEYGGKVIYIDPINLLPGKSADADIILVTHGHDDHFNWGVISQLVKGTTTILVTSDIYTAHPTLAANTIIKVAPDSTNTVQGISIEAVFAYDIVRSNHDKITSVGYILNLGSTRFYHSGDTDLIPEMASYNVDIACIPMGQTYTFTTISQAVEAANRVGASVVLPMHYGMYEGLEKDPWTFKDLADGDFDVAIKKPIY